MGQRLCTFVEPGRFLKQSRRESFTALHCHDFEPDMEEMRRVGAQHAPFYAIQQNLPIAILKRRDVSSQ